MDLGLQVPVRNAVGIIFGFAIIVVTSITEVPALTAAIGQHLDGLVFLEGARVEISAVATALDTYLRKHGFAMDTGDMNFDIEKIRKASHATQDAALLKKDVVVVVSVQQIVDLGEGMFNLNLVKLTGDAFQVQVPAGASVGTVAAEVLKAGGYMNLIDLKLVMPDGDLLSENDSLPKKL